MSKIRVYEYAKKQNISSKEVIEKLKQLKVEVTNHMSTIDQNIIGKLDGLLNKKDVAKNNQQTKDSRKSQPKQEMAYQSKNAQQKNTQNKNTQNVRQNEMGNKKSNMNKNAANRGP